MMKYLVAALSPVRFPALAALPAVLTLAATPAQAQSDPRLVAAVRAAQEGQGDSARAAVQRLLAATPPTDTLYPQILYTQAMVSAEAADMRRALQRVVVEHGGSSWADDALLRLVQMDYATRSLAGAARNLEKLRQDYPLTPLLPQAAYWAARTYFDLNNPALACRWLADGMTRSQDNVELHNQLGYLNQRCGTRADPAGGRVGDTTEAPVPPAGAPAGAGRGPDTTAPATTARDTTTRRAPTPAPAGRRTAFRVQVSAVATPGAADDMATRAEALGYPVVIVREGGLYKVRAGAYTTREEAQAAVSKLKAGLGGSPFVVAEP